MEQLASFEIAEYLYNNGIIINSNYCYCRANPGIKAVKTDKDNNLIAERTYHYKSLEKVNPDWGIEYPSENWISAPNILDIVIYLEEKLNIAIIPVCNSSKEYSYKIYHNGILINTDTSIYYSFGSLYNNAIMNFINK